MSLGGEERWAPFPVQDWSTMPPALPADEALGPEPTPASPGPARRWWVPLVALLCLGLVIGTGSWLARRSVEPRSDALRYVPADGDARYSRLETTRESDTRSAVVVTESARFAGVGSLLSGDPGLTTRVLRDDFGDPGRARLWRTTTTSVDAVGIGSQTVRYYRVRGSVELAGEQDSDGTVTAYAPALVELPADVGPGSSWRGAGTVGATLDYRSSFTATRGGDGCLDVTGELDLSTRGAQRPARRTTLTRTWCPGRGLVAAGESAGDVRTVLTDVPAPAPSARTTVSEPVRWTDPAAWTPRTWDTRTTDDVLGDQPMNGLVATDVTPVLPAAGLVVRAMSSPADLVATTPKTPDAWVPVWRAHPGGAILSLAAFGSVVVVTTSERRLVAYSDAGVRLWERRLAEVAPSAPVRASDTDAVLVDLSGAVTRFAVADGRVVWQHRVGADVVLEPAVGAGLVVVADRGGTVTALDLATGSRRWDTDLDARGAAVAGGQVVVVQDQQVFALDPGDGSTRWLTHVDGTLTALAAFAGRALVATKDASLVLDDRGAVRARMPGYLSVDVTEQHLAGWTDDRLDVVDTAGRVVATWPTPATSLVSSARPGLATPQGAYLFGWTRGWTFQSWTTGG